VATGLLISLGFCLVTGAIRGLGIGGVLRVCLIGRLAGQIAGFRGERGLVIELLLEPALRLGALLFLPGQFLLPFCECSAGSSCDELPPGGDLRRAFSSTQTKNPPGIAVNRWWCGADREFSAFLLSSHAKRFRCAGYGRGSARFGRRRVECVPPVISLAGLRRPER
jgi:hypothetical protein